MKKKQKLTTDENLAQQIIEYIDYHNTRFVILLKQLEK